MKTKRSKTQTNGLQSQNEQLGTAAAAAQSASATQKANPEKKRPYVNYKERDANRELPTERVMELLRSKMPEQYALAEIVGKWVWVTFAEIPSDKIRAGLSQIGFHWNNARKCWQHPCGQMRERGTHDPREKYGSHFPADQVAA